MNILQLNTSLFGEEGQSSRFADEFVSELARTHPGARVTRRDLAADPIPHLTAARFRAGLVPPAQRTPAQQREAAVADRMIEELANADVLVIGLPMYNFSVPSPLKAWFDHVARAGTTFRYTSAGSEGLMKGKRVYIFATRGGVYADEGTDHQTPYVRQFLAMLGMDDVEFVYAEGLALGDSSREKALKSAGECVAALAA